MSDRDEQERAALVEAGRLLFSRPTEFLKGVVNVDGLPPGGRPEFAFAGRSNVGKSSLINALTRHNNLARTSNTPGRTQEINFFGLPAGDPDGVYLVDLPGYGYARESKSKVRTWTNLITKYLAGRAALRRVFVLVDSRHGVKANDEEIFDLMDTAAVSYQVVLTKADKPKKDELAKVIASTEAAMRRHVAAHPQVLVTASKTGLGLEDVRAEVAFLRDY
ncbi:ribosome biogenesis GTP-binding protein YihA/YsxC [Pyruvatibacter sp. HU-CL02332]|uniref:ribosome biogenesis GTP-binding protein YihA/YsxC n=1 Tax=Pyruvatibacter sp. HU-CL02332 TaxID=3127650 RepID=UPI003103C9F2